MPNVERQKGFGGSARRYMCMHVNYLAAPSRCSTVICCDRIAQVGLQDINSCSIES
jgi:hypothetical protein